MSSYSRARCSTWRWSTSWWAHCSHVAPRLPKEATITSRKNWSISWTTAARIPWWRAAATLCSKTWSAVKLAPTCPSTACLTYFKSADLGTKQRKPAVKTSTFTRSSREYLSKPRRYCWIDAKTYCESTLKMSLALAPSNFHRVECMKSFWFWKS